MAFDAGAIIAHLTLDSSKFRASLEKSQKQVKKFGNIVEKNSAKIKKFSRGMVVAGAAIVGALGLMVKKASDFEEAYAKFGTVFQDVTANANAAVKDLTENYGLSTLAAVDMLSATGDLLVGLGMQGKAALSLSERTQRLAIDLASFTNLSGGSKRASEALTKAMLGEREMVKALGIVITEEMVKEHLLTEGKEDLTGMARLQARAEATLAIAISQSGSAMGDYERTQGSLANVVRRLASRLEDLWIIIGTKLLPITTEYAEKITKIVEKTVEWIEVHPKLTSVLTKSSIVLGGILVTLGGMGMALPSIVRGFKLLSKANVALGGTLGIVTLAAAATYGALKLLEALRPAEVIDEQTKAYKKLTEVIGFWSDFEDAAVRAGVMGREDLIAIWDKYEQNTQATLVAIATGTEGKALREFLSKLTKGHSDALVAAEEHGEGLDDLNEDIGEQTIFVSKLAIGWELWAIQLRAVREQFELLPESIIDTEEVLRRAGEAVGGLTTRWVAGTKERTKAELSMFEKIGTAAVMVLGQTKLGAIAQAIMSTHAGAAKSLEMLGMPLAIPFIAMAIVSGMKQVASIIAVPIPRVFTLPSAEEGAYLPSPTIIEAGHGPLGEVILPLDRAPISQSMRIIIQNSITIGEQTFYRESVKSINRAGEAGDLIVPNRVVV